MIRKQVCLMWLLICACLAFANFGLAVEDDDFTNVDPKTISSTQRLEDPEFRVDTNELGLSRVVEMLQWVQADQTSDLDSAQDTQESTSLTEDSKRTPAQKEATLKEASKKYSKYHKEWRDAPVMDAHFDAEHKNPQFPVITSKSWIASYAKIDGVPVETGILNTFGHWDEFRPSFNKVPSKWSKQFEPEGNGLSSSANPLTPQVGDVRIGWRVLKVPTLVRQVVLVDGVWRLPANVQLDQRTRELLIAQRQQDLEHHGWRSWFSQTWFQVMLGVIVLLLIFLVVRSRGRRRSRK